MRERQPLEMEDFDTHWQLDQDVVPKLNWSDIAQSPERVRQRTEALDGFLANSSESTMPYAGYHLRCPELVNSHHHRHHHHHLLFLLFLLLLLLLANHMRPVKDHSEPGWASVRRKTTVASRPRIGGDSQAHSWYRPAGVRPSWVGTSWKGSAGQGPAVSDETGTRPKGFSYVYSKPSIMRYPDDTIIAMIR